MQQPVAAPLIWRRLRGPDQAVTRSCSSGDLGACADQAYAAWAVDRAEHTDSVLIAPTRDLVAELNIRARSDRVAGSTIGRSGPS